MSDIKACWCYFMRLRSNGGEIGNYVKVNLSITCLGASFTDENFMQKAETGGNSRIKCLVLTSPFSHGPSQHPTLIIFHNGAAHGRNNPEIEHLEISQKLNTPHCLASGCISWALRRQATFLDFVLASSACSHPCCCFSNPMQH